MRPPPHNLTKGLPIRQEHPNFGLGSGFNPVRRAFKETQNSFNLMNNATIRPHEKIAIPLVEANRHKNLMKPGNLSRNHIRVKLPRLNHIETTPLVKTFE
jgi:hypothetical protein